MREGAVREIGISHQLQITLFHNDTLYFFFFNVSRKAAEEETMQDIEILKSCILEDHKIRSLPNTGWQFTNFLFLKKRYRTNYQNRF